MLHQHPALFPEAMDQGFTLHDYDVSVKQDLVVRRITVTTTGVVFTLRPSLVMPSMIACTDAVEKALSLRQWGVPFDALASVFGREAMCWYRAWLACGRPALLGTTVTDLAQRPTTQVADAKVPGVAGQEVDVPTTVGAGCFLGVSVVAAADTTTLEAGSGACARAAQGPRARLSPARDLHRWLASDARGVAAPRAEDHASAVLAARGPPEQGSLHGRMAAPGAGAGLARLSGGDHTAVRATSPARGRVDADAPQWRRSRDGVEEVSPSCRLHPGV
jgi:hypothetical protein